MTKDEAIAEIVENCVEAVRDEPEDFYDVEEIRGWIIDTLVDNDDCYPVEWHSAMVPICYDRVMTIL